jgi:hypothetical protein
VTKVKRKEHCDYLALSGFETLSWPTAERRQLAAHLCRCERCQVHVAVKLLEWEQRMKVHQLPAPPAMIGRWRSLALHLCCWESSSPGDEQHDAEWGWQIDQEQEVSSWRADLEQAEEVARAMWRLDGNQEERVHTWLQELENQGQTMEDLSTGESWCPIVEEGC